ncbi:ABC transporter ATP-binding protein [Mycolicibacter algericus]|uniref:Fatty acid ABC transporter ATP-binding/permease protein n=2 Tax=Mycolicibacter algericus TaxID=1288388 RepID=A0A7I9Y6K4_MYCAL|nr:ABC transporter ATP-binding protein [Mycolicibacter algericus]OQZ95612.1 ABC transporter ATP-binding protein [Mycolicibacter algericus DSM 45454]GFG84227.1 putative ABC transporter ATP-binding protein [Mycolicibacter algericus]
MTPPVIDPAARAADFSVTALRLVRRMGPQRRLIAAVIGLSLAGIAIGVAGPRILGHATDLIFNGVIGRSLPADMTKQQAVEAARAADNGTYADMLSGMNVVPGAGVDFAAVARTLALAMGLYLVGAVMIWAQARLLNVILQRTLRALRRDVEDKIHRLPLRYFDTSRRGELLSRVTNDVDNTATSVSMTVSQLFSSVLTVLVVLAMMVSISPLLAAVTLVGVPVSLLAVRAITRRSQRLFAAQWAATGRLGAHLEETYSGFTLVRTFGHRDWAQQRFDEHNDELYRAGFGAQFFSGLVAPATGLVGNLGYVAVAVIGGVQVATGQISLGSIQAFIAYVRQFNQPLGNLAGMYNTLLSGAASAERVFAFLDEPEEAASSAVQRGSTEERGSWDRRINTSAPLSLNGSGGRVEFRDVGFGYRPGVPVIEELSLSIEPGSTVAIVGPTGAGKTTLVNLLMRFYDVDRGQILIDGVDIAGVDRSSLRSAIGMVLQDTWLFTGTIADNIGYGRPDATEDEVLAAARAAHVDAFVRTLPKGYATRVSDDGAGISAGEKQLITIARAFLARPQLLILDEATSSVDTRTELLIQRAMRELRRDRTSFIIAHRLSTIRDADVILVMQAGRIVEQGTHAELLARRGAYWAMTEGG